MPPECPPWTRSDVPVSLFSPGTALVPHRVKREKPQETLQGALAWPPRFSGKGFPE